MFQSFMHLDFNDNYNKILEYDGLSAGLIEAMQDSVCVMPNVTGLYASFAHVRYTLKFIS